MKRELHLSIMSILFAIVTSIFTIGLTSCDKEVDTGSAGNLEGTTWINDRVENLFDEDNYGIQLSFTANNKCTLSVVDSENVSIKYQNLFGTYTKNADGVTMMFSTYMDYTPTRTPRDYSASAKINGNKMTIIDLYEDTYVLTKL